MVLEPAYFLSLCIATRSMFALGLPFVPKNGGVQGRSVHSLRPPKLDSMVWTATGVNNIAMLKAIMNRGPMGCLAPIEFPGSRSPRIVDLDPGNHNMTMEQTPSRRTTTTATPIRSEGTFAHSSYPSDGSIWLSLVIQYVH